MLNKEIQQLKNKCKNLDVKIFDHSLEAINYFDHSLEALNYLKKEDTKVNS